MFPFLHSGGKNSPYRPILMGVLNTVHTKCFAQGLALSMGSTPASFYSGFCCLEDETRENQGESIFKLLYISGSSPSLFLKRCSWHLDTIRMGKVNVTFLSCFVHLKTWTVLTELMGHWPQGGEQKWWTEGTGRGALIHATERDIGREADKEKSKKSWQ